MTASFPTSIKSFPLLVDYVDWVLAIHQNQRGDEITAIETSVYNEREDTKEPTGWLDPDGVSAATTYDSSTQKITVTGTFYYYWRGVKKSITDFVSSAHTNTTGHIYRLYSTDGDTFTWSTDTEWEFSDLQLAAVNYQSAYKYGTIECHGLTPWQVHDTLHHNIGTYKESGGTLDPASYTLNSATATNRRPDVVSTYIRDEDITHVLAALTSETYNKFSLSSTNTVNFSGLTAEIVSVTGAQPNYNLFTGGAWTQAALPANNYMCVWLVAQPTTKDTNSQSFRYFWIQGQSAGTLASQQALSPLNVSLGALQDEEAEFVFLLKVIIQYIAADWKLIQVDVLSGNRALQVSSPSGNFLSGVSTDGSLTGNGTTSNLLSTASGESTATAAGTTTLIVSSATNQIFTGTTTQDCVLPVVSNLRLGQYYWIINESTGVVTVKSSGGNTVVAVAGGTKVLVFCKALTGTDASSWSYFSGGYTPPTTAAANDFQVGDGSGNWIKKTLAETVAIIFGQKNLLYPFGTYINLSPLTASSQIPFSSTLPSFTTYPKYYSQALFIDSPNDASNYWVIDLKDAGTNTIIASVSTQGLSTGGVTLTDNSMALSSLTQATHKYIYVISTKVGSPANLFVHAPAVEYNLVS